MANTAVFVVYIWVDIILISVCGAHEVAVYLLFRRQRGTFLAAFRLFCSRYCGASRHAAAGLAFSAVARHGYIGFWLVYTHPLPKVVVRFST